jgi:predicted PurR-regulated permease PerM
VFVILFHLIVVTNIDNFLRPILVPKAARLDSALMLLAVFSGIAMFGAWGIVIGPVLMIVIVTTISVYLAVYKGVPMATPEDDEKSQQRKLLGWLARRGGKQKPVAAPAKPAVP